MTDDKLKRLGMYLVGNKKAEGFKVKHGTLVITQKVGNNVLESHVIPGPDNVEVIRTSWCNLLKTNEQTELELAKRIGDAL